MVLMFMEEGAEELSRQALTLAEGLGDDVEGLTLEGTYAPAAWARAIASAAQERHPSAVIAAGTDRGNEVLAHVASMLDQPMAANCVSVVPGRPASVKRMRWG
jgi:electron transfer flavoprotein alpha subunit